MLELAAGDGAAGQDATFDVYPERPWCIVQR